MNNNIEQITLDFCRFQYILLGLPFILILIIVIANLIRLSDTPSTPSSAFLKIIVLTSCALILILIAFPCFKLLYSMGEVSHPAMSALAECHQGY